MQAALPKSDVPLRQNKRHKAFGLHLELLEDWTAPAVFTVTNTLDSGTSSLRQAILDANANPNMGGPDQIAFNIPTSDPGYQLGTGSFSIAPLSALLDVTDPVVVDGYSYSGTALNSLTIGDNAVLRIEFNGASPGDVNGLIVDPD